MSQKAICPRGHIWDPSTIAGLPPTATPRCPICGEEEPLRASNALSRLNRWFLRNPPLAVLSVLCLLLGAALLLSYVRQYKHEQDRRQRAEESLLELKQFEARRSEGPRVEATENKEQQRKRQEKHEAERSSRKEKELEAELREARKTAFESRKQRDEQIEKRKAAEDLAQIAEEARQEAVSRRAETAKRLVKLHAAEGIRLMERGDLSASLVWFTEALRLAEKDKLPAQTHRLRLAAVLAECPRPVQMWLHDKMPNVVQLSSDGKRVLTAAGNSAAVWDTASGKRIGEVLGHEEAVTHAAISPDGKRVLTATADKMLQDMALHLWDVETSKELITAIPLTGPVVGLAFSPDGKRFLTVTDKAPMGATEVELHVRDGETGEAVREAALGSEISPRPAVFSPDGKQVLTLCQDRCARIWDIATGKQIGSSFTHTAALVHASISLDGERVLTASRDGMARVWKAKTGEPVTPILKHGATLRGASLSPDGGFVLTFGEDHGVRVWDTSTGETVGPALQHGDAVNDAVFSPDGRCVLTTNADGTARLWDYRKAVEILPSLRHGEPIHYAAFTPAGDSVLTLAGQVVRLWDLTVVETALPAIQHTGTGLEVFSPDGKLVLRATDTAVRVYETQTNHPVGSTLPHKNPVSAAAFSPDGKRVLTVSHQPNGDELEGHVRVWETATGERLGQPLVHPRSVLEASFSRDGRRVLTACQDGKARLWDVAKNTRVGEPMEHKQDLSRALFLPDGKRLLTVDVEGGLRLWDAATAEPVGPTWGHRQPIHHLSFSRDGQHLVTACADGTASVWEANTGSEIATTPPQGSPVGWAAFSADGKSIVTVSDDQRARAWDASNGKPAGPPLRHRSAVRLAAFSEDGKRIVTVAADGMRIWEAASGEPITPLMRTSPEQPAILDVSLGRDGRLVLEAGAPGDPAGRSVRDIRADERPVAELLRVSEVLSAERMTDTGELAPLDRAELSKAWQAVQKKYGKEFAPSAQRLTAWHHQGAAECERQHLWIGALRHLDPLIAAGATADLYGQRGRANQELRRWAAAKSDYTQALADKGDRWDLWAGRAEAEAALGEWKTALADYSKAIERKSDRAELWAGRGRIEAEQGDWRKAAADLEKALHLGEQDAAVWRQHLLALLAGGDQANYRRWCGRMVQRFGDSEAGFPSVVWSVALVEGAVRDWKPLVQHAERAVAAHPERVDYRRQLALLLYRAGQFDAALKRVQEASRPELTARDGLLMALAAQRLGRSEEAKKGLVKAEQVHRDKAKDQKESWEERLVYETLHREAETLVRGGKP